MMNPHAGSLDDASDRLLAQLKSSDSDREELYRTLLVKLRFLTNGAILSEGGVSIIRQAYMFIEHQPQLFRGEEAASILRGVLAAPRASIGKKAPAGRPGQSVETVYTLAASALFALHADAVNWPVELLKYYVLDALGPRHWVDNPDLSLFTENLLQWSKLGSSVGTVTAEPAADDAPAEEEEETLAGGGGDIETVALKDNSACLGGAVKNRFSLCMAEAREVVWSALLNRVDTNYHITVDAGSGTHAVILTLAAFSGMPEVRTMAAGCLPRLLGLISAEEEVRGLLMAVADGLSLSCRQPVTDAASTYFKVFTLIPSDVSVIFQLVKLRLMLKASRSQQDMYRAMLCKLAECSAVIGRIVVQVLIEDDILLSGTAPSRADTIKLLMKIFEVLDSHNLASNLKDSVENNHKLNSPSSKLFGLAVHDILSSRLRIESRSSASVSSTAWDYNRDSILADVIVKVLQLMSIRKIKLLDFLKSVLVDPLSVCKALSQSAGHMPNVDMVTSVRQNSFVCLLAQGTHDTAPRRKAVSDVLWFYSELSKMLQVLLCHEICIIDGILRKKDQVDGTTDGGSTGASRPSLGRGVAAPGPIGSGGRVGSWAKPGGVGLTLSAGRSGLTLGRGRGGIPAGLTLNRSGSKPSRPFPISALTRPGASPDARLESPRERSGSMDSTDGDTGQVDLELMPTHLQESRRQLLLEILSLQEASLEWLHQTLSLVSNPSVMCCSLLPTNSNTGRPSGGISATNSHTGTIDSTATSDFISGVAVSKDGAPMIPTGDSPCIFTTTIGGVPTLTEFKDDHIRLWLSWIKACLCINLNQNFNRTSVSIDRSVVSNFRDHGVLSSALVLRLLGIVRLLNVHSYNTDISRLCNGVETKSKIATSTAAAYGNHFTNNRQRDVLSIVNALDLLDALVLRGVRTNIFDGDDRNKNSALMIDDVQIVHRTLELSQLSILTKLQFLSVAVSASPWKLSDPGGKDRYLPSLPPLALKSLYWRCVVSCYILACARPSTLGLHIWTEVPDVKGLMLMSITSQFGSLSEAESVPDSNLIEHDTIKCDENEQSLRLLSEEEQLSLYSEDLSQMLTMPRPLSISPQKWKYGASYGIDLVVAKDGVSAGHDCSHRLMEQAVEQLEKRISATLFTEISTSIEEINQRKIERKDQNVPMLLIASAALQNELTTDKLATAAKVVSNENAQDMIGEKILSSRKRQRDFGYDVPAIEVNANNLIAKNIGGEDEVVHSKKRNKQSPAIEYTPSPLIEPLSSAPAVQAADDMEISDSPSDSSSVTETIMGDTSNVLNLRRSSRIRHVVRRFDTAVLVRSGGTRRRENGANLGDSSSDEIVKKKRKRRKKKSKKGLKLSALKKNKKGKSDKVKIQRLTGEKLVKNRPLKKLRADGVEAKHTPVHNLIGYAYTTQFGRLMTVQPPFQLPDGLPHFCELIVMSVKDFTRDPPRAVKINIRSLDAKYKFGEILRGSTAPDFIASAVLAGSDSAEVNTSVSMEAAEFMTLMSLREHLARSSCWILSTISADSRVMLRIPPVGCAHLFLIVACGLVRRVFASGVWDADCVYGLDALWSLLLDDVGYSVELQQAMMLSTRLLQSMGYPGVQRENLADYLDVISVRNSTGSIFKILSFELCNDDIFRRCAARLAIVFLSRCSEFFAALSDNVLVEQVEGSPDTPMWDRQLRYIFKVAATPDSFAHDIVKQGPWWDHCLISFWNMSLEVSTRSKVDLTSIVTESLSSLFKTENHVGLLVACLVFLCPVPASTSGPMSSKERDMKNLKAQAVTRGVISLLAKQPVVAAIVLVKLHIEFLPIVLSRLLDDLLEHAIFDGLVRRGSGSVRLFEGDKHNFIQEFVPVHFISCGSGVGVPGARWAKPLPRKLTKTVITTTAQYEVHFTVISGFITAIQFYIQNYSYEELSAGWHDVFAATICMLNTMDPKFLLSVFRDNILSFGSDLNSDHFILYQHFCSWMSMEVIIALLILSKGFCYSFSNHLIIRLMVLLNDPTGNVDLDVNLLAQNSTRAHTKPNKIMPPTPPDIFFAAFAAVSGESINLLIDVMHTACNIAISSEVTEFDQVDGFMRLLKQIGDGINISSSLLMRLAFSRLADTIAARSDVFADDVSVAIFTVIESAVIGVNLPVGDFKPIEKAVMNGKIDAVSKKLTEIAHGEIEKLHKVLLVALTADTYLCLGVKLKLIDSLFSVDSGGNGVVQTAMTLFDTLCELLVNRNDAAVDRKATAYLYYRIIAFIDNDHTAISPLVLQWISRSYIFIFDLFWKTVRPLQPSLCCCYDSIAIKDIYQEIIYKLVSVVVADSGVSQEVTLVIWTDINNRLKNFKTTDELGGDDIFILSVPLLAAYTAHPEEMLVVVAEEAKNLYSSVLYACYSSLLGGKTTHVSAIGAQTILSLKTCSSESSFLLRNESFADMNMHLLTAFVQKLMKSSLARRFKCSVDMLVLHLSIVACSRNYTIDRKRTIFNAEYERSASDQIIWTAANHPILWCMTVPVFLQVMEQLVCKTDLQAYSFPMRSVDDLLFLHASSRPGHTRSHMLALTLSPQVDRTDEVVIFISNLKVAIESIKEVERSSINANVGPIWASPYSITRGKEPFSKLSEYVVNYFDQNFATDKGASFLQNGDS